MMGAKWRSLLAVAGFWAAGTAFAAPAISGYGAFHEIPGAAYVPSPKAQYRVVFTLDQAAKSPADINRALDRVARTVNLYVASGVPLGHLHFVAVISGPATPIVLDNAHYHEKFGVDNPNVPLIAALHAAGVDVAVCGQAVHGFGFEPGWLAPGVTQALSALTTVTLLEQQGYVLMPL
ncbi:DsrE family protein [Solimonas marina]|uniref:DsrE family protein n=1 Tax=Solimonas marina TaxID=2714601 RepID=A0A969W9H7_9GAMM|nr:DsrE family protein [Solimonas marina]NKF23216.1 DsrE family protein [Solimonas marina]